MAARTLRKATTNSSKAKRTRPDGSVSTSIFEAIEKMVAEGTPSRTAAFKRLAKETGRNPGTVAANYYYVARKRGTARRPRRTAGGTARQARTALGQPRILSLLSELSQHIRNQAAELETLRRENQRFAAIRKLLHG